MDKADIDHMRARARDWREEIRLFGQRIVPEVPAEVWPWIRLLEKEELEDAGFSAGHITDLPSNLPGSDDGESR